MMSLSLGARCLAEPLLFLAWPGLPACFYFCALPVALLLACDRPLTAVATSETGAAMPERETMPVQLILSGKVS
jgi:hypothetical protein